MTKKQTQFTMEERLKEDKKCRDVMWKLTAFDSFF